ncbi:hypothetical protein [Bifidobacterium olomucense]|uniref:hypothetical protein n=1 Tax=Bifidobacterium olomucense TaxID=2675324 RepID=UPI00145D71A8|nr:hypothetical protein [Bifidobacterium sp. DSM 109959]
MLWWSDGDSGREPVVDWRLALSSWEGFRLVYPAFVVRGLLRAVRGVEPGYEAPEALPLELVVEDLVDEYLSRVDGSASDEWFMLDPARLERVVRVIPCRVDLGDDGKWRRFRGVVLNAALDSVPWDVGDPVGDLTFVLLRDAGLCLDWHVSPSDVLGLEGAPTLAVAPVVVEAARLLLRVGLDCWAGGLDSWHGTAMSMAPSDAAYVGSSERDWRSPSWLNGLVRSMPAGLSRTYVDAWRDLFRVLRHVGVYRRDHHGKWVQAGPKPAPPISEDALAAMTVAWEVMLALADPASGPSGNGREARLVSRELDEALGRFTVDEGLLHRVRLAGLWRAVSSLIVNHRAEPERMSGTELYRRMRTLDALGWEACPTAETLDWLAERFAGTDRQGESRMVDECGILLGTYGGFEDSSSVCLAQAMLLKYVLESFPDHGGFRHSGNDVRAALVWGLGYVFPTIDANGHRRRVQLDGNTDWWRWEAIRAARAAYLRGSGTGPGAWLEHLKDHAAPTITSDPNGTQRTSTDPEAPWAVTIPDDTRPA